MIEFSPDDEAKLLALFAENPVHIDETLLEVLKDFDIPDGRRNTKPENLRWIRRNVAIRNGNNHMLPWVMAAIDLLLKKEEDHA